MANNITTLASRLEPILRRRLKPGNTTIVNNYITETPGGGGGPVDLSWLVPKSFPLIPSAPITVTGDFWSSDMTFGLSLDSSGGLETSGGNLRAKLPANSGLTRDGTGLYLAPSTLTVGTSDAVSGAGHTHAVTAADNPGAASSLLKSSGAGYLTLVRLIATERLRTPLIDTASGDLALSPASGITTLADLRASTRLRSPLLDTASGALSIAPATHIELNPGSNLVNLKAGKVLQSENYVSQTTGMRVSYAGEGDFRYLYTDEMHAKVFIADLEQALAGGQIISKSVCILDQAFTAPAAGGAGWIYVKSLPSANGMDVFEAGDFLRIRTFSRSGGSLNITDCWGTVRKNPGEPIYSTNAAGEEVQQWHFTRRSGTIGGAQPPGGMAAGAVVPAGTIILDYGVSGNGYYEVNAIDGLRALNSPYAQVVTWASEPATGRTVNARFGNLRGIFGVADEYGLYVGSGTTDASAYLRLSNTQAKINNVPLQMWNSGVNTGNWYANGQLDIGFGANGATVINERDFTVHASGYTRLGWASSGYPNLFWSQGSGYLALRSGTTDMIRFDVSGDSYFAGRLTIGTNGELVQGSGTMGSVGSWELPGSGGDIDSPKPLWGSFTGLRIGRSGSVGLWAAYNAGQAQAWVSTDGKVVFGRGLAWLDSNGVTLSSNPDGAPSGARQKTITWVSGRGTTMGQIVSTDNGVYAGGTPSSEMDQFPTVKLIAGSSSYLFGVDGAWMSTPLFTSLGTIKSNVEVVSPLGYVNGSGFPDGIGTVNISSTGWKRVGKFTGSAGRGFARVSVFRTGGETPFHLTIEAFSTWTHTVGQGWINVYGGLSAPISAVRITSDGTSKYLEINVTATSSNFMWRQDFGAWPSFGFSCNTSMVAGGDTEIVKADISSANINMHVQGALYAGYLINAVAKTPTSSADTSGMQGEMRWDASYIYVCTGTSNPYWKRAALSTW